MPEETIKQKIEILQPLRHIILGAVEIDQEAAVLEEFFRRSSQNKVIARLDELAGACFALRDKVKKLTEVDYINKNETETIKQ